MKHKKIFILVMLLIGVATYSFGASLGDYRSTGSANWGTLSTWQVCTTAPNTWSAASSLPTSTTPVFVQSGHTVTLAADAVCGNLNIARGNAAANTTYGRVALTTHALEVYGTMRTYYAAVGTVPGTDVATIPNMLLTSSSTSGKVIIRGATRSLTSTTSWQDETPATYGTDFYAGSTSNFHLEIDPGSTVTITIPSGMRPQSWNIVSGTVITGTKSLEADNGTNGFGDVTIAANATLITNTATGIAIFRRMNAQYAGAFTLDGIMQVNTVGANNLNMGSFHFNGTVIYAGAGAQTFLHQFVTGAAEPKAFNHIILSGSGIKTLDVDTTINGDLTITGTASLALGGNSLTYGAASTLIYAGTGAQTTSNSEFPASGSVPQNVNINNASGVTLNGSKSIAGDLTLQVGTLAMGAYAFDVQGTTYVGGGSYTGGTGYTDGFNDVSGRRLTILENNVNMAGFTASTAIGSHLPDRTDREWTISATFTGSKELTLYWTESDDNYFDWAGEGKVPSVYLGGTDYGRDSFDVSVNPRHVTVTLNSFAAKGAFLVGFDDDPTLPVELSSFTAILTSDFFVRLHWITQSETEVRGFYIYRGTANDVGSAVKVSPLIEASNTSGQHSYEFVDTELTNPGTYYYWLNVQDLDGGESYHGPTTVYYDNDASHGAPGIPLVSGFSSIYPNPFNPSTTIAYGLNKNADVSFIIYNSRGQIVRNISEGQKAAGNWKLTWDGLDDNGNTSSTGVYYIKMNAGKDSFIKKAVLLK